MLKEGRRACFFIFFQEAKLWHYFFNIGSEFNGVKKILSFLCVFFIYTGIAHAQDKRTLEIIETIQRGSAEGLAVYFNANIDLTLVDDNNEYSKVQATMVMKDFFTRYPPLKVSLRHSGNQQDGSCYAILDYRSMNRENFRLVFYLKPYQNISLINELRFDLLH